MFKIKKGSVDYEYDRYGNIVRKYVVVKMVKVHGKPTAVWQERELTKAELTKK